MEHYIYKTTNLVNNKFYFGMHHGELDDSYLGSGVALNKAINKYGREHFKKEVILVCESRKKAEDMEKIYVKRHLGDRDCYNMTGGGRGSWAHTWDSTVRKLCAIEAQRGKNGFKDKTHTAEAKAKIGKAKQLDPEVHAQRKRDYDADDKSTGCVTRMSELWGIKSQPAGRYIKNHFTNL